MEVLIWQLLIVAALLTAHEIVPLHLSPPLAAHSALPLPPLPFHDLRLLDPQLFSPDFADHPYPFGDFSISAATCSAIRLLSSLPLVAFVHPLFRTSLRTDAACDRRVEDLLGHALRADDWRWLRCRIRAGA